MCFIDSSIKIYSITITIPATPTGTSRITPSTTLTPTSAVSRARTPLKHAKDWLGLWAWTSQGRLRPHTLIVSIRTPSWGTNSWSWTGYPGSGVSRVTISTWRASKSIHWTRRIAHGIRQCYHLIARDSWKKFLFWKELAYTVSVWYLVSNCFGEY